MKKRILVGMVLIAGLVAVLILVLYRGGGESLKGETVGLSAPVQSEFETGEKQAVRDEVSLAPLNSDPVMAEKYDHSKSVGTMTKEEASSYVTSEEGFVVMRFEISLTDMPNANVVFEGVARRKDGVAIATSKDQEVQLLNTIEERLKGLAVADFRKRTLIRDMKTVFEDDLQRILDLEYPPRLQITQLTMESSPRK